MGRPEQCNPCCGGSLPSGDPPCNSSLDYNQASWVEEIASGVTVSYDDIPPTGELIEVKWQNGNCESFDQYDYQTCCDNDTSYNFLIKKEFYMPSGAYLVGKIYSLTSAIDSKIIINHGNQSNLVSLATPNYNNPPICCPFEFCGKNTYTAPNSGCMIVMLSGSINYPTPNVSTLLDSGSIFFELRVNNSISDCNNIYVREENYESRCSCGWCCIKSCGAFNGTNQQSEDFWECFGITTFESCSGVVSNIFLTPIRGSNWEWTPTDTCAPQDCDDSPTGCQDRGACCKANNGGCLDNVTCEDCQGVGDAFYPGKSCFGEDKIACLEGIE